MVKIYYNDKPLILTKNLRKYLDDHPVAEGYASFVGTTDGQYMLALKELEKPGVQGALVEVGTREQSMAELQKLFTFIQAGGGLVTNELGAVLMIYRRGKWDLPKGKLDEGEDLDTCAVREVKEETGLRELTLGEKIVDTYHIYIERGEYLLKQTAWYRMSAGASQQLLPQKEENIMEARWIPPDDLGQYARKSYQAIHQVLKEAGFPG